MPPKAKKPRTSGRVSSKKVDYKVQDSDDYEDYSSDEQSNAGKSTNGSVNGSVADSLYDGMELVIEKLLGRKFVQSPDEPNKIEESFLVKWKGLSYLHVSWEYRDDLEKIDLKAKMRISRFLQSITLPLAVLGDPNKIDSADSKGEDDDDIEYYPPDLVEVHRIISCNTPTPTHSLCVSFAEFEAKAAKANDPDADVKYLVKWRGQAYNECTWEYWRDIKFSANEVYAFWQRQRPPPRLGNSNSKPAVQEYQRLTESPRFGEIDESDEGSGLYLREYQLEGVNWLLWNWWHKRPCILADEMGLGKTIQTVCFLHQLRHLKATRLNGPFLIVAPLSLINQWQNEMALWSPDLNCVVVHGSAQAREMIVRHEFYFQEPFTQKADVAALKKSGVFKFNVVLTTYEMIIKEPKIFTRINWKCLIVDEAHRLKNPAARLFEALRTVPRDHCILLTGTPLQNKTEELWSLLHFADKNKFGSLDSFIEKFGDLRDASDVAKLHALLKPYLLRRIKEDVEKSLPPKEETIIEVALTPLQKQYYRAIYEKNTQFLFKGARAGNMPSLMNIMMELRKCCNHPFLIKGVEDRLIAELPLEQRNDNTIHEKIIECAGKMVLLNKLLPRLYEEGHKVLIFSQMVRVLNLLEDFLKYKGYTFERLDGSLRNVDRNHAVERFTKPSLNRFIMLLSTRAGGLGLNLTAADTVIIFDSDWNPHNDIQAQARAHRIGQTKAVKVYRLLTRKTYEMHMFHKASMKLGMDKAVLAHARNEMEAEDGEIDPNKSILQVKEIDELLKRGAYDVFRDDDTEQSEFVEADIDSILQRNSHVVNFDHITANSMSNSLGGFSKATFVSADEKEDVDINDPDFWKKAVGLTAPPPKPEDPYLESLPQQRQRKQTQVYGRDNTVNLKEIDEILAEDNVRRESKTKEQKDNKVWGVHSRDRVLRCLCNFGFGRWEKIRAESGTQHRDLEEIESFARSYIMQCGLAAAESSAPCKNETSFVSEAIQAAKSIDDLVKKGEKTVDIPPILLEEKFLAKLKSGGVRKILNKLGILLQLYAMISDAVDIVYAKKGIEKPQDIDIAVSALSIKELADALPLGDVRPNWTRIRPWWDLDCDRSLLAGVFVYGFGRYEKIKDDPELKIAEKISEWITTQKIDDEESSFGASWVNKSADAMKTTIKLEDGYAKLVFPTQTSCDYIGVFAQPGSPFWMAYYGDSTSGSCLGVFDTKSEAAQAYDEVARNVEGVTARTNFDSTGSRIENTNNTVENLRIIPLHRSSKYRGVRASGQKWTAQISREGTSFHLGTFSNEIDAALAYDEAVQQNQAENAAINFPSGIESELKRICTLNNGTIIELFAGDGSCILSNKPTVEANGISLSQENDKEKEREQNDDDNDDDKDDDSTSTSRKDNDSELPDARIINRLFTWLVSDESARMTKAEIDARNRAIKKQKMAEAAERKEVQARQQALNEYQMCRSMSESEILNLHTDMYTADGTTVGTKKSLIRKCENVLRSQLEPIEMVEPEESSGVILLPEVEVNKLCAGFIVHGAPFEDDEPKVNFERIYEELGIDEKDYSCFAEGILPCYNRAPYKTYSWADFIRYCGTKVSIAEAQQFYKEIWLPFCLSISKASSFTNKYSLPHPYLPATQHCIATKSLCSYFLFRQRYLRTIKYLMTNHLDELITHLKTYPARFVNELTPAWWCPWIHDIGVLLGCVKYGYLSPEFICSDADLPFAMHHLKRFIRRVFLYGTKTFLPAGHGVFRSKEEAEEWVECVCLLFPEQKELEIRVLTILTDFTKHLPPETFQDKAKLYRIRYRPELDTGENPEGAPVLAKGQKSGGKRGRGGNVQAAIELIDPQVSSNVATSSTNHFIPTVPLSKFLLESAKRRKLAITNFHDVDEGALVDT